jgi:superfamily II DNA or RNA helicase
VSGWDAGAVSKSSIQSWSPADWRLAFDDNAIARGNVLAAQSRVFVAERGARTARAVVRGDSGVYFVEIDRLKDDWAVECTCPRFADGHNCKHLWAVLVFLEQLDDPRAYKRNHPSGPPRLRPPPPPPPPEWRQRLTELSRSLARHATQQAPEREERLWYVLVTGGHATPDRLVVELRRSYRLKSGAWSAPARFEPAREVNRRLPSDLDQRVVALLRQVGSRGYLPTPGRLELERDTARTLLPMMSATGCLVRDPGGDAGPRVLSYNDADEARLERTLQLGADAERVEVTARWLVNGEPLPSETVVEALPCEFLCIAERLVRVGDERDAAWLRTFGLQNRLVAPRANALELLHEVKAHGIALALAPGLGLMREDLEPRPVLTLVEPVDADFELDHVRGRLEFEYGGARASADDSAAWTERDGELIARHAQRERELRNRLDAFGVRRSVDPLAPLTVPLARIGELVGALTPEGWTFEGEGARYRTARATNATLTTGVDWFELKGQADFGGASASLPTLLAAAQRKSRYVELDDGTRGLLPRDWLARFATLAQLGDGRKKQLRFTRSQAWMLDALLEGQTGVATDKRFREITASLRNFQAVEPAREPAGFQGELRPYQRDGLGWLEFLERHGLGGCLADDMGLGKTVQVLAWLLARRARNTTHAPSLVVAPKSLTHNWLAEARRFAPQLRTLDFTGAARRGRAEELERADLVVTTYGSLRIDAAQLDEVEFDVVVLDEAQNIKNAASQTAKAARVLHARQRVALSGTPIENHLGELWSLFEFLNPGMLGRSAAFEELLRRPAGQELDHDARAELARIVRPFVLRRTKEQVLRDLPAKSEQVVTCVLEAGERKEYDALREHYRQRLLGAASKKELDHFSVLEALLRLRQAACHPGLLDPQRSGESSAKLDLLLERVQESLEGEHKALVFSQFTSLLAIVRQRLDAAGTPYAYIDGGTSAKDRASAVVRFQDEPECKLLLSSLKAGGVGLNLTAADYVFLLDPWWNPAAEAQAIGRAHRMGQQRSVFAYRFVSAGTIEERVLELQERKRELAAVILDGEATTLRDLTREDLERLLR